VNRHVVDWPTMVVWLSRFLMTGGCLFLTTSSSWSRQRKISWSNLVEQRYHVQRCTCGNHLPSSFPRMRESIVASPRSQTKSAKTGGTAYSLQQVLELVPLTSGRIHRWRDDE
jgi:hypothetical protein